MVNRTPKEDAFTSANWQRSAAASKRDVDRAREALKDIQKYPVAKMTLRQIQCRQRYMQVLRVRVEHPQATLTQLAGRCSVNKDIYSARLKRAFTFAERLKERNDN